MLTASWIPPTGEQLAVIDACTAGGNVVVEAGAGTGKTSTLLMAAIAMDGKRGIYLAYNRTTAQAARKVFPASVTCVTAHALAYRAGGYRYDHRLPGRAQRMPSWGVASVLGIGQDLPLGKDLVLTRAHLARIVMATVERFCHSDSPVIGAAHVPGVRGLDADSFAELTWQVVPMARLAWADIRVPDGRLPFKHDHYLKLWQLNGPTIPAAFVMFDEAQDANPVTAAIVQNQHDAQQIIVGDSCQAIYGWRGAQDTLPGWPCDQRLRLRQSFRFGEQVAAEANKWLDTLDAAYRLAGLPTIPSTIGTVSDPEVIICRTNAEAFEQARAAQLAGRRAAFGGGTLELKQLAEAALDLNTTGRTGYAELAAFRRWGQVRDYVRTDAAGADLAAGVRLIDKHGAAAILAMIDQLSGTKTAQVIAITAHAAKGHEWERVRIAADFREPSARGPVPRSEAMLAYVAVTRARIRLDRSGLAWIDTHPPVTAKKEPAMKTRKPDPDDEPTVVKDLISSPYAGGRAQAESGCRIIASEYDAWSAISTMPGDHPKVTQLGQVWHSIRNRDLGDDPGPAGVRYRMLSHAAAALAAVPDLAKQPAERAALEKLAGHARIHSGRLHATAEQMFLRSRKSGPYTGNQAEARSGSRIIEDDYRAWSRTPTASRVARDSALSTHDKRIRETWDQIRSRGLADGPSAAADRYQDLAATAAALADAFTPALPSADLPVLLNLANHSAKHAIRLRATADVLMAEAPAADQTVQAVARQFEVPPGTSTSARSSDGQEGGVSSRRLTRARRSSQARAERER